MMLGRVDEVDGHYVATRFAWFLLPVECVYIARPGSRTTSSEAGGRGLAIQTVWHSVALAYMRVWLPVLGVLGFVAHVVLTRAVTLAACGALGLVLGLALLARRGGELSAHEKARLRLLGTITSYRIDPTKLLPTTRERKRDQLGDLMAKAGIPLTPDEILAVIDDIPMPAMPLVYAYACYVGDDPVWRECAEILYSRCEQSEV